MGNPKPFAHAQLLRYLRSLVPDSKNVALGNILAATKEVIGEFAAAVKDQAKEIKRLRKQLDVVMTENMTLTDRNAILEERVLEIETAPPSDVETDEERAEDEADDEDADEDEDDEDPDDK